MQLAQCDRSSSDLALVTFPTLTVTQLAQSAQRLIESLAVTLSLDSRIYIASVAADVIQCYILVSKPRSDQICVEFGPHRPRSSLINLQLLQFLSPV